MSRVVIVGASVGGLKTAQALRSEGFEGEIVLVDLESHPTYDKPPLSKKYLTGETARHEIELLTEEETRAIGASTVFGSPAASLDTGGRIVTLEDGTALSYDTLVIATGSRARQSPWGEGEHIHLLRTSADAERLRDMDTTYTKLATSLRAMPAQIEPQVLVPLGPLAFFPGTLQHTNEVTVLLGDNHFARCSAANAARIADMA